LRSPNQPPATTGSKKIKKIVRKRRPTFVVRKPFILRVIIKTASDYNKVSSRKFQSGSEFLPFPVWMQHLRPILLLASVRSGSPPNREWQDEHCSQCSPNRPSTTIGEPMANSNCPETKRFTTSTVSSALLGR